MIKHQSQKKNLYKKKKKKRVCTGSENLENRALAKTLELPVHLTSEHKSKHLEITKERPEGVTEYKRSVAFHEEVTIPSQAIAGDWSSQKKDPAAEDERAEKAEQRGECAEKVKAPGGWLRVLGHIVRPELLQVPMIHNPSLFYFSSNKITQ